jgi:hypothetical protein
MFDAMVSRGSLPYAPSIMRLIQDTVKDRDFSEQCVAHKVKRLYVKKTQSAPALVTPDSFMRDARSSAQGCAQESEEVELVSEACSVYEG